jgi:L-ascorbate metabolism protein UlaG (beta-lactamase superfamily)
MALWKQLIGLKQPRPEWYDESVTSASSPDTVLEVTYLGTAGFILSDGEHTVVLDPYVSRPGVLSLLSPLVPNQALIRQTIPVANDVLVGHAHYDHILDAPDLCQQTGARLIGSDSTIQVGRAAGLPEQQLLATQGHEDITSGTWMVRGLPSRHGQVFGRIPFPGDITEPPSWPPRMAELKHGLVLNWLVDTGKLKIVHIDSADFINDELAEHQADIVCLCAIGRRYRPNYVKDVVRLLRPKWIIPCHWDTMMTPLHEEPDLIPTVDLPGFIDEIRAAGCEPLLTPILGKLHFPLRKPPLR